MSNGDGRRCNLGALALLRASARQWKRMNTQTLARALLWVRAYGRGPRAEMVVAYYSRALALAVLERPDAARCDYGLGREYLAKLVRSGTFNPLFGGQGGAR
jgi:hypothetical protein